LTSPRARADARTTSPPRLHRRHRLILAIVAVMALALALASAASASTAYVSGELLTAEAAVVPINLGDDSPGTPIVMPGEEVKRVVMSPDGKTVYALGENNVTGLGYVVPISTETNLAGTAIEAPGLGEARSAAISPDGKTMYVTSEFEGIFPVNLEAGTVGTAIPAPFVKGGIAFSPDGTTAYYGAENEIGIIDVATGTLEQPILGGAFSQPFDHATHILFSPDGGTAWVTPEELASVAPIDTATKTARASVATPGFGANMAFTADGSKLWVLNTGAHTGVVPIDPTTETAGTPIEFAGTGISVASFGAGFAVAGSGNAAYITSERNFIPVNLQTGTVGPAIRLQMFTTGVVVSNTVNPGGASNPTITTTEPTQSAVIGDPTNPTMTISIGQLDENGEPVGAENLTVTAHSSNQTELPDSNILITGSGSERVVHFDPIERGVTQVTLTVTGEGGKTGSVEFSYAISEASTPTSRVLEGGSDESTGIEAGEGDILVADDELSFIKLFDAERSGMPLREYNIGTANAEEVDFEASAKVGNTIYWLGSHGNTKAGDADPERQQVIATEVSGSGDKTQLTRVGDFTGMLRDMLAWDKERGEALGMSTGALGIYRGPLGPFNNTESSANIEGAEFAPNSSSELYLGMREPTVEVDGKQDAVIVPVTNINRVVEGTEAHAKFAEPILLDLDGMAIREIRKNAAGQYLIIGGVYPPSGFGKVIEQALFSWTGERGDQPVRLTTPMPQSTEEFDEDPPAWEGIGQMPTELTAGSQVRLIMDNGESRPYNPDNGTKSKQLTIPQWRKSRTDLFTLTGKVGAEVTAPAPTFAAQAANTIGAGQWVTVTNTGSQTLVVDKVRTDDTDGVSGGDFLVSQDECIGKTIKIGETCKVQVRFAPSRVNATSNADLMIEGNVDTGAAMVPLTATSTTLPAGEPGPTGPAGSAGATGPSGAQGAVGTDGTDGTNGTNGTNGTQGPAGAKGDAGAKGEAGARGEKGERGEKGAPGKNGTVSFTADRSSTMARRGGTTGLAFVLRNGSSSALPGGSVTATLPKGLKVGGKRTVAVAGLDAGHSRKVTLRLKVASGTPAGTYKVPVELSVGGHSVTATVTLKVRG
jgi:Collagen triple helix repeat (20 copies)/NPCBM-associated, NEW3 domain of alpha-galactosidase/WD40-like Beta Propeller Repeat